MSLPPVGLGSDAVAENPADTITLARAGSPRSWTVAALSLVLGVIGAVAFVADASVLLLVLGILLLLVGAALVAASLAPKDVLVVDDDAIGRDLVRRNQWRLRWAHMAAVRIGTNAVWLVPLDEVADHPQIAPALAPRDIDGVNRPTFEVPLDPRSGEAVRAAVTRHAPSQLLAQSSPRPPST